MTYSSATLLVSNEDPVKIPLLEPELADDYELPSWARFEYRTCRDINNIPCNEKGACLILLHLRPAIDAFNHYRSIDTGRIILHGKNTETSITGKASHLFFNLYWQLVLNSNCRILKKNFAVLGRQYSYSTEIEDIFFKFYSAHITRAFLTSNTNIDIEVLRMKTKERFNELKYYTSSLFEIIKSWELWDATKNALVFIINILTLMHDDFEALEDAYRLKLKKSLETK